MRILFRIVWICYAEPKALTSTKHSARATKPRDKWQQQQPKEEFGAKQKMGKYPSQTNNESQRENTKTTKMFNDEDDDNVALLRSSHPHTLFDELN